MRKRIEDLKEEKREWKPRRINNKMELTIIDAIEQVTLLAEDSSFCPAFFRAAKRPLEYLAERLSLSKEQATLFSLFVNFSNDSRIRLYTITEFVGCTQIEILRRSADLEELRRRRFISRSARGEAFCVSQLALKMVKEDRTIEMLKTKELNIHQLFELLKLYISERNDEFCDFDELNKNVDDLLKDNSTLPFVEKLKSYDLDEKSRMLLLQGCNMLVNNDDSVITFSDISFLYDYEYTTRTLFAQLNSGKHPLITLRLLQCAGSDITRPDFFELGKVAIDDLLGELCLVPKRREIAQSKIDHTKIDAKALYYNPSEEEQISQLQSLLQPDRFERVCNRLTEKGMRRGFATLFYGAPGTGKTETARQLARLTGRDIILVNISELRDKYVGESEKCVKALFDNYRKIVKEEAVAPILLFNEADAIISKRSDSVTSSVDKMENALQNIILQEIEDLEGILIATTNLTSNMDRAFERRFLYKVEFNVPTLEAKCAIWHSMLPNLTCDEVKSLATAYDFSGGQIENIARKYTVAQILTDSDTLPFEKVQAMCNEELLDKGPQRKAIGF